MPAQKSAAGIAAYHGEPEDCPSLFSGSHQLPSKQGCPALASGHRCAWARMIPIDHSMAGGVLFYWLFNHMAGPSFLLLHLIFKP